jgi:hypothetical protein
MAAAAEGEVAVEVDEVAAVLVEEAADLVAGLAAVGCRDLQRPLADLHRSAVVALDPAAVVLAQVALAQGAA